MELGDSDLAMKHLYLSVHSHNPYPTDRPMATFTDHCLTRYGITPSPMNLKGVTVSGILHSGACRTRLHRVPIGRSSLPSGAGAYCTANLSVGNVNTKGQDIPSISLNILPFGERHRYSRHQAPLAVFVASDSEPLSPGSKPGSLARLLSSSPHPSRGNGSRLVLGYLLVLLL